MSLLVELDNIVFVLLLFISINVLFINFTISKVSSLMLVVSEYRVLIYGISFIK